MTNKLEPLLIMLELLAYNWGTNSRGLGFQNMQENHTKLGLDYEFELLMNKLSWGVCYLQKNYTKLGLHYECTSCARWKRAKFWQILLSIVQIVTSDVYDQNVVLSHWVTVAVFQARKRKKKKSTKYTYTDKQSGVHLFQILEECMV